MIKNQPLNQSPVQAGYSIPAEWDHHDATWIGWPHCQSDWPGKFSVIPWAYGEMVRKIAMGESVRILVQSPSHEKRAQRILQKTGVPFDRVEFIHLQTNRGWTRDFGPIFIRRQHPKSENAIVRFRFNAWAKYRNWQLDDHVPEKVSKLKGYSIIPVTYQGRDVVLEGGAIDVNGQGSLITTEECLLDQNVQTRNPGLSRKNMESIFHDYLGVNKVIWLGKGITGDDTHGHVDDLCRFVSPNQVVLCREPNIDDPNYWPLQDNWERLQDARLEDGSKLEVISLPMPKPLYFENQRLPASYANFYICNAAVLVPTFNDPSDRIALGILAELFNDREVIGIHAVDLVWGFGTLHCLTQQEPSCQS